MGRGGRGRGTGAPDDETPPPDLMPLDPNGDQDKDGYTPNQGDCNDWMASVNPSAIDTAGNNYDDDCDGMIDNPPVECDDPALVGKLDGNAMSQALSLCGKPFVNESRLEQPSDPKARAIVSKFGVLKPLAGSSMVLLSTGRAADKNMSGYTKPQIGTDLGFANEAPNPDPNLPTPPGCGMSQPPMVNDYTEWVLRLKVPSNAHSFSFKFHFFSAEYPEFVCTMFNDAFLVMMESPNEFAKPTNISFDEGKNPITVNNGFFTVCQNSSKPQTMNCKKPVSDIAGTGYEDANGSEPVGGSTGWLTTTAPVTPNEEITLRFIIFDEGDHIYDSSVLIDDFKWAVDQVDAPTTIQ
jgi:hypothetical protein